MYNYEIEKPRIFTDEGQRTFLKVRDEVNRLLEIAGCFKLENVFLAVNVCDSFMWLAYLDRLVELGEIREIKRECMAQHKIYIR